MRRPLLDWRIALASLALAAPLAADGNVTVYVDAAGDLWAIGDDLDNGLRIGSGGDDQSTFEISGTDATTTINGATRVTLFAPGTRIVVLLGEGHNVARMGTDYGSNPSCCDRDLVLLAGTGDDTLFGIGPFPSVFADLGPGDDRIVWGEGASDVWRSLFRTGDGADEIDIDTGVYDSRIEMGAGNDRFTVSGWGAQRTRIDLESGDDRLFLHEGGDLDVETGPGNDSIELQRLSGGSLSLDTSSGADEVLLTGDTRLDRDPIDPLYVWLGPDDDRLSVGPARIGTATFDGSTGTDVYINLGSTFLSGGPALRNFEAPKPTFGPPIENSTRIAGRVVDERGSPVPDAAVFGPELGLLTATDPAGAFQFDSVASELQSFEIVVGATVRDRPRSGAARVERVPLGTSDAGVIVLGRLRNVLVYGAPPVWAPDLDRVLEGELVGLGRRSAEVSRLAALPEDLSPYGTIWHVGSLIPLAERQALKDFVRSGRGLVLSGGTLAQNAALEDLLNALVSGGGIDIGGPETSGPYQFNPQAAGGVTRIPNVLTSLSSSSFPHRITGLEPRNVLITAAAGTAPAAVWDSMDLRARRGRMALVTAPFWMRDGYAPRLIENLLAFLLHEPETLPR